MNRRLIFGLGVSLGVIACGGATEDSGTVAAAPDITGRYNIELQGASGCEGEVSWVSTWAIGALKIEGEASELLFDFGDDYEFTGWVDSTKDFAFFGNIEGDGYLLEVEARGGISFAENQWVLEGDLGVTVDDDEFETNNCTVESRFVAVQLVGMD